MRGEARRVRSRMCGYAIKAHEARPAGMTPRATATRGASTPAQSGWRVSLGRRVVTQNSYHGASPASRRGVDRSFLLGGPSETHWQLLRSRCLVPSWKRRARITTTCDDALHAAGKYGLSHALLCLLAADLRQYPCLTGRQVIRSRLFAFRRKRWFSDALDSQPPGWIGARAIGVAFAREHEGLLCGRRKGRRRQVRDVNHVSRSAAYNYQRQETDSRHSQVSHNV